IEWAIVIVRMPAASRPAALFERILLVLNENQADKGTTSQKMDRVVSTLNKSGTQLVFIDEVHNVLGSGGDRTQDFMLNVFKDLANECKIPFILMGTKKAKELLARNEEVSRRFPLVELKPFKGITKDFREFMAGFEKMLPLKKESNLASNKAAMTEILRFSKGLVADISAVIRASAIVAIESGTEKITLKEIKKGEKLIEDRLVLE
ncbi:TniB family NTP-binding protein, partial [archaeon]|nr:TniB family NTP-binding protein [archaeon]